MVSSNSDRNHNPTIQQQMNCNSLVCYFQVCDFVHNPKRRERTKSVRHNHLRSITSLQSIQKHTVFVQSAQWSLLFSNNPRQALQKRKCAPCFASCKHSSPQRQPLRHFPRPCALLQNKVAHVWFVYSRCVVSQCSNSPTKNNRPMRRCWLFVCSRCVVWGCVGAYVTYVGVWNEGTQRGGTEREPVQACDIGMQVSVGE